MIYLFGILGVVFLALCGAVGFEHERLLSTQKKLQIANDQIKAAQERATALALLWAAQVDKTDAEVKKERDNANAEFAALMARAKVGGKCVAPRDISSLLRDITNAANAARVAGVDQSSASPVPRAAKKP